MKTAKIRWRLGTTPQTPFVPGNWGLRPQTLGCALPLPNPRCATALFPQSI